MLANKPLSLLEAKMQITTWLRAWRFPDGYVKEFPGDQRTYEYDFAIGYELVISPQDDRIPYVDIFVAETGEVGLGLERRERLARRGKLLNLRRGFAVGHEPRPTTQEELATFLDAVSQGKVILLAKRWPLGILGRVLADLQSPFDGNLETIAGWKWIKSDDRPNSEIIDRGYVIFGYDPFPLEIH